LPKLGHELCLRSLKFRAMILLSEDVMRTFTANSVDLNGNLKQGETNLSSITTQNLATKPFYEAKAYTR
jgi:hypothetical protein